MDLLLILTYTAICIVIFKVFKLPLNKWTVPTAVLGGIVLIGSLIFLMNYNHPYSEMSRTYFVTTPIVPMVSGQVIDVPVEGNKELNKGDVLFQIDPTPFINKVNSLKARQLAARQDLERVLELQRRGVGKQSEVDAATAQLDSITSQLDTAEFNLANTTVKAPTKGYATQIALRPGVRAVNIPLRPAMVFVNKESMVHVGWFRQNSLLRLKEGYEAEVAFDGIPGKVFSGVVKKVLPVLAEGQIQASGTLVNVSPARVYPGRVPVYIEITDPEFEAYADSVPGGAFGQAAIYSDQWHHVAIMRKVILRMSAWMNYFFPFH